MTLGVAKWLRRSVESGPADGTHLTSDDRRRVGAATRLASDLVASLGPVDAIVLATTVGDPSDPRDPHGLMRRAVHRAFVPAGGTTIVTAGARTVVAGLIEASLRLADGQHKVALVLVDWIPAREIAVALELERTAATHLTRPELQRCGPPPSLPGRIDDAMLVGAVRLARALDEGASGRTVVLDREPRDSLAWTTTVAAS